MNPPNMILHIIDPRKDPLTALPLAFDTRIMLRLMAGPILLAGKATLGALRTAFVPAKEVLAVAVEVLA